MSNYPKPIIGSDIQDILERVLGEEMPRGRKKAINSEFDDAHIMPVANGYIVQSSTTKGECFVFNEIDEAFDFIKGKLKPTTEQKQFVDKV